MGKVMVQQPWNQLLGQLLIVVPAVGAVLLLAAGLVPPAANVHLVDVQRAVAAFVAALHPCAVVKVKVQLCQTAGRARPQLGGKCVGVAAHHHTAVGTMHPVFIKVALCKAGDECAPHAGIGFFHGHACLPAVEAAADFHCRGTGGPHRKAPPFGAVVGAGMRTKDTVGIKAVSIEEFTGNGGVIHAKISLHSMIGSARRHCMRHRCLGNISNKNKTKWGIVADILVDS